MLTAPIALLFALAPQLDLGIARLFFVEGKGFVAASDPLLIAIRNPLMWIPWAIAGGAAAMILRSAFSPALRRSAAMRQSLFLIATLALGPGLTVNALLKEHYGRPRPVAVQEFGGKEAFVPWWQPGGTCQKNCSFVSGEAAAGFWLVAPAALTPAGWRIAAFALAALFGAAVGLLRMSFGGHFFTDVFFAGLIVYLETWAVHALMFPQIGARLALGSMPIASLWQRRG